jgi:hypothetical protein
MVIEAVERSEAPEAAPIRHELVGVVDAKQPLSGRQFDDRRVDSAMP